MKARKNLENEDDWHGIHWVVNEVEGNRITKVGLRLH